MIDGAGAIAGFAGAAESGCETRGTRDVLLAHRWLRSAREEDPRARLVVRRRTGTWQTCAPVLEVPELPPRTTRRGDALAMLAAVPAPPPRSRARLRVASLLAWAGLAAPAVKQLLRSYEGFFPGVEVGVAWGLHSRLCERGRSCLACLDLRSLTLDLVAGAIVWTLPEVGGGRWPAGVHLFSTGVQAAAAEPRARGRASKPGPGPVIPHAAPR